MAQCFISADIVPSLPPYSALCPGETLTVTANPFGGTPPYTYQWSNGQTTQSIVVANPGLMGANFNVTITDDNGCIGIDFAHLKYLEWSANITIVFGTYCLGESTPLTAEIFPYYSSTTFAWSTGETSQSISINANGNYSVTITSPDMPCPFVTNTIEVNSFVNAVAPDPGITGTTSLCPGQNGTLTATGGPFATYVWAPTYASDTETLPITDPGVYTLYVTNEEGCAGEATFEVLGGGVAPELNMPAPICAGQSTTVEVTNPSSFTSFNWSNGASGPSISVNSPGTYTVTVSAGGSCSATGSVEVTSSGTSISLSGSTTANTSCTAANGEINLSSSPAGSYDYNWSNGETTEDLTGIAEGTYVVTVTEPGGCSATASFAVAVNTSPPVASANPTPAFCSQPTGSIDLNMSPPGSYTFEWSNGSTTEDLTNIAVGTYSVTATSTATGCSATSISMVGNTSIAITVSGNVTDPSNGISNGAIDLSASPAGNYDYAWSNGATTEDLTGLGEGTYVVTVSEGSCTGIASFTLVGAACDMTVNIASSVPSPGVVCVGDDVTILANVSGGTAPYTYAWSNGATTPSFTVPAPISQTYVLVVTDDDGCTALATSHIKINVWYVDINYSQIPTCQGETLTLIASTTAEIPGTTYTWSTGQTGFMIEVASSGTYSVSMTHPNVNCTAEATVTVTIGTAPAPNPQIIGPATLCSGQSATLNVNGGPFSTYTWSDGSTDPTLSITDPGTYSVIVTNAEGCTGTDFIEVQPSGATPLSNSPAPICPGQSTTVEVTNPGEFLSFQWSNGGSGPSISVSNPGTYTVTATAAGGCTATASAEVLSNGSSVSVSGVSSPITSCVNPDGEVDITPSPAGTYNYIWSNSEMTEDLTGIAEGNYTVTVTDGGGCTASASFNVVETTNLPDLTANVVAAVCGNPVGSIDLTVAPAGSYTFAWSNGTSTEDLTDLPPGDYTVSVTATATGCSASETYNVPNNSNNFSLSGSAMPVTNCGAANGSIDLNISPSGSYDILWSNGAATEDLLYIAAGNFTVTVTQGGACTASASFIVDSQVGQPQLSQNASPASCGQADGSIDLSASPAGIYTYFWSNGATTEDLTGIASGNYSVTVSATSGCSATTTATVAENTVSIALTGNATANSSCTASNGGIDLNTSPTGTYSFLWSNGMTSEDLQNIAAGSYTVTVSAGGNCSATATYPVPNNSDAPSLSIVTDAAACGLANGGVNLTASPSATYAYLWSNGATSEDLTGIAPGSYSVTVTGANGCSAISSSVVVDGPASFTPSGIVTPVSSCTAANGSIDLSVTPAGSYGFLWSNGQATEDLTGIAAGNYMVTISLGTTCSTTASYVVTGGGDAPVVSQITTPAACGLSNGSIDLSVSPANGSSFTWSNGATTEDLADIAAGTYSVTCTGANGCTATLTATVANANANFSLSATPTASTSCISADGEINLSASPSGVYIYLWSNGATSEDLTGIAAGTYSVTATDANGCSTTASVTVNGTAQPQVALSGPAEVCAGSFTTLTATPGFLSYLWSNGQAANSITVSQPGDYSVTATDMGGCTAMATHNIAQLPAPAPVIEGPSTICGGSTEFTVAGGVFTQFLWNTGAATPSITVSLSGDYSVTVTDASGCTGFDVATLSFGISLLPAIVSDAGTCDGTATLDAGPGYASYLWSNGATTQNISVSNAATYTVTVSDGSGCTGEDAISVSIPNPPQVAITGAITICQGSTTTLSVPAIFTQINWSTGASTASITASQPTTYNVTVTDANGCTATDALTLTVGSSLSPDITATLTDCNGTSSLDAGTGFASYLWSNGATTPSITVIAGGSYLVTVSDGSGCTGTAVENYVPPTPPTVQVLGASAHCEGDFSVLVAEGDFLDYLWSTGQTSQEITVTQGGDYSVTVSDANGCTAAGNWTITPLAPSFTALTATSCSAQDTGTVQLTLTNQFGCDSVVVTTTLLEQAILTSLSFEACAGESVSFNGESIPTGGSQEFVFAGANGCDSIVVVNVEPFPLVNYELEATKTCWNSADGSIEVTMLSGKEPYLFALDGGEFQLGPAFTGVSGGSHAVMVEDANGCVQELGIQVPQQGPSQLEVEDVTIHCEAENAMLRAVLVSENPADAIWLWSDGSTLPTLEVSDAGKYTVQVDDGCEVLERVAEVRLDERYFTTDFFYVPNSFSPNGDGINDEFRAFPAPGFEVLSFELRVFDRWGDEQFVAFDPETGWDGIVRETERQPAVHVWFVKATVAGCGGQIKNVYREGDLTIMR